MPLKWIFAFIILYCEIQVNSAVICEFCNNDFVKLGRHTWRCTSRITSTETNVTPETTNSDTLIKSWNENQTVEEIRCICGKICKGRRGLKAHKRSCKTTSDLQTEILDDDIVTDNSYEQAKENNARVDGKEQEDIDAFKALLDRSSPKQTMNGKKPTYISK